MQNNTTLSLQDALSPEHITNPYPVYHRLRSTDPVLWDEQMNCWILTRYYDVVPGLRDQRFSAARFLLDTTWFPAEMQSTLSPAALALTRQMLFLDPPDHTRLRGLVARAFTPRVLEALRPRIQNIADTLLDATQANGRMDVMHDFAYPLPAIVIAEMLGVPPEDRDQFFQWTGSFGLLLGGNNPSVETVLQALHDVVDFIAYFRKIIEQHRSNPRDDLMQAMITAEEQGDRLSEEELLGNCILLLAAGHGTTTHLIGNGLLALLQHSNQLEDLKHNPSMISLAVMELLRFDGPVQITSRVASANLGIGGKRIKAGDEVIFHLGAASRDPAQFAEPDQLNLSRQENRHLAFGQGIHFCLGAPLARIEAEIAFNTLLRRLQAPQLETAELEWNKSLVFRGTRAIPITFT
ncbi:MAG TPA: cytochrome P450 [Ktedonosporobacter sp.]|nr:cytochrome P450 [Ktedonosporobacter sp.]